MAGFNRAKSCSNIAGFNRTQVSVNASPIANGRTLNTDEETVQSMWDAVRQNFKTDMKPLSFASLPKDKKHSWATALKRYIDQNDDIQLASNDNMKTPNGHIQISRRVTIKADTVRGLNLGPMVMVNNSVEEKVMLMFSQISYGKLKSYIESVKPSNSGSNPNVNAFAMAMMLGALMAAANDSDSD